MPFGCRDVRIHKTGNAKLKNKVANYYKYYTKKIPMYFQVVFLIIDKIIFPQPSICAPKSAIVLMYITWNIGLTIKVNFQILKVWSCHLDQVFEYTSNHCKKCTKNNNSLFNCHCTKNEELLHGKLHFFCSVFRPWVNDDLYVHKYFIGRH